MTTVKKAPVDKRGKPPGVMKEFMMNNLFDLYHTKTGAQGYGVNI